jgi:hypothetical protein
MFRNNQTGVTRKRLECLSTLTTDRNTEQVHVLILKNKQETSDEVAKHLQASHGSAFGVALLLAIRHRSLTISQRANIKSTEQGLMPRVKREVHISARSLFALIGICRQESLSTIRKWMWSYIVSISVRWNLTSWGWWFRTNTKHNSKGIVSILPLTLLKHSAAMLWDIRTYAIQPSSCSVKCFKRLSLGQHLEVEQEHHVGYVAICTDTYCLNGQFLFLLPTLFVASST